MTARQRPSVVKSQALGRLEHLVQVYLDSLEECVMEIGSFPGTHAPGLVCRKSVLP